MQLGKRALKHIYIYIYVCIYIFFNRDTVSIVTEALLHLLRRDYPQPYAAAALARQAGRSNVQVSYRALRGFSI